MLPAPRAAVLGGRGAGLGAVRGALPSATDVDRVTSYVTPASPPHRSPRPDHVTPGLSRGTPCCCSPPWDRTRNLRIQSPACCQLHQRGLSTGVRVRGRAVSRLPGDDEGVRHEPSLGLPGVDLAVVHTLTGSPRAGHPGRVLPDRVRQPVPRVLGTGRNGGRRYYDPRGSAYTGLRDARPGGARWPPRPTGKGSVGLPPERLTGFEPATSSLARTRSTN